MTPVTTRTPATTGIPATTGTPATWYRAAAIRPIAPSVTSPTTRRPGRISATMVCGILAHKVKKKSGSNGALFFHFYARNFPCSALVRSGLKVSTHPGRFSFGAASRQHRGDRPLCPADDRIPDSVLSCHCTPRTTTLGIVWRVGKPNREWILRQVIEAFPWDHAPRDLIRD